MAKLTQTELKVLAKEITARVKSQTDEINDSIKNSEEYLNFEEIFMKLPIGQVISSLLAQARTVDNFIKDKKIKNQYGNYTNDKFIHDRIKSDIDDLIKKLKVKEFPLVPDDLYNEFDYYNDYRDRQNSSVFNKTLHKLQLMQLTTDEDIAALIDSITENFVHDIKEWLFNENYIKTKK